MPSSCSLPPDSSARALPHSPRRYQLQSSHLATLEIDANTDYGTDTRQLALSRGLIQAVSAVPGVQSAGIVSSHLPVGCNCDANTYRVLGPAWNSTQQPALSGTVSAGYFAALQARLLSGRFFTETDDTSHPPVAIINKMMAQQFFPGEDPIGRTIGDQALSRDSLHQVIGVVDDVREGGLNDPLRPAVYLAVNQNPVTPFSSSFAPRKTPPLPSPNLLPQSTGSTPASASAMNSP